MIRPDGGIGSTQMIYSEYKVYGPYTRNSDGRQIVILVHKKTKAKITVSYPKFLMECKLNRILDPNEETVDHKNRNFLDNDWDNLQLLSRSRHCSKDAVRVKLKRIRCVWCDRFALKSAHNLDSNSKAGKAGPFCGKSCAGQYGAEIQNSRINKFDVQPRCFIHERSYYTRGDGGIADAPSLRVGCRKAVRVQFPLAAPLTLMHLQIIQSGIMAC